MSVRRHSAGELQPPRLRQTPSLYRRPRWPANNIREKKRIRRYRLEFDFAGEDVLVHDQVAAKAVQRVPEAGRPIALKQEVTDPGQEITDDRHEQQQPPIERHREE